MKFFNSQNVNRIQAYDFILNCPFGKEPTLMKATPTGYTPNFSPNDLKYLSSIHINYPFINGYNPCNYWYTTNHDNDYLRFIFNLEKYTIYTTQYWDACRALFMKAQNQDAAVMVIQLVLTIRKSDAHISYSTTIEPPMGHATNLVNPHNNGSLLPSKIGDPGVRQVTRIDLVNANKEDETGTDTMINQSYAHMRIDGVDDVKICPRLWYTTFNEDNPESFIAWFTTDLNTGVDVIQQDVNNPDTVQQLYKVVHDLSNPVFSATPTVTPVTVNNYEDFHWIVN